MNYANIKNHDIANGLGVRVSLFVSGCRNHCPHCFQPETWDFDYGQKFTDEIKNSIIDMVSKPYIKGLTVLGGEPLEPENQYAIYDLILTIKDKFPNKDIWLYTGFTWEMITDSYARCRHTDIIDKLLENIDVLVDGQFVNELKDITLKFRGSSNQRIIDVQKSLMYKQLILYKL